MTSFRRNLIRSAAVGAGLAFLTVAALAGWLLGTLPKTSGEIAVLGLGGPAEISRDAQGVPHIRAGSSEDAAFALGYAHAQDRLWQMEITRRVGAGRLAEVVGEPGLPSDRFMRLLGLYRLAERQAKTLSPQVAQALQAYAAGVNAWISGHRGFLPPEYALLRLDPEPWQPADSLVWIKLMAARLSGNWRDELLRARLSRVLTEDQLKALWPAYPDSGPFSLAASGPGVLPSAADLDRLAGADPQPPGVPKGASNAWVLGGERTDTGKPILANDPHLGFQAPVIWYLARLEAPGLEFTGATAPGMPFPIIGHNGRIAWGMTSIGTDMEDLFIERLVPGDSSRYQTPDGSLPFVVREERIGVRDNPDTTLTVRSTRHGPVISDLIGPSETPETVLAFSAVYLDEAADRGTPEALYGISRAGDWESFVEASRLIGAPQQNVFYADVAGNIGFIAPGRVPLRKSGRGRMPAVGWTGEADWAGFVPFDALPRAFNPSAAAIVNANNPPVGGDYPYFLTDDWAAPHRARRILELLAAQPKQTVQSTAGIQLDSVSLLAADLLPLMMRQMDPASERDRRALDLLRAWDGTMSRRRPEPLLFTAWLRELSRALYADELGPFSEDYRGLRAEFVARALGEPGGPWCDDVATAEKESCPALAGRALATALDGLAADLGPEIDTWRWGDVHRSTFRHPVLSRLPLLDRFVDLTIPADGGDDTINRGSSAIGRNIQPYAHIHGAGLRVVFDLADLERSRFMIATGQSGNPVSAHYSDLLGPWRDGASFTIEMEPAKEQQREILRLVPAGPAASR